MERVSERRAAERSGYNDNGQAPLCRVGIVFIVLYIPRRILIGGGEKQRTLHPDERSLAEKEVRAVAEEIAYYLVVDCNGHGPTFSYCNRQRIKLRPGVPERNINGNLRQLLLFSRWFRDGA